MKQAAAQPTTKSHHADGTFGVGIIATTFLDTTWRIATPVVLCTLLGIFADRRLGTKPWLTLPSVVIGFVCAVLLVKRQLAAVQKAEDNS
ncbi:MAG TPA: AtpZ/AtpI family protein [Bacillota bacterium]|nr:AtpZ/AtpI family protein [Bacillota bacterium]